MHTIATVTVTPHSELPRTIAIRWTAQAGSPRADRARNLQLAAAVEARLDPAAPFVLAERGVHEEDGLVIGRIDVAGAGVADVPALEHVVQQAVADVSPAAGGATQHGQSTVPPPPVQHRPGTRLRVYKVWRDGPQDLVLYTRRDFAMADARRRRGTVAIDTGIADEHGKARPAHAACAGSIFWTPEGYYRAKGEAGPDGAPVAPGAIPSNGHRKPPAHSRRAAA